MNKQSNEFTATQTETGFHIMFHNDAKEFDVTVGDLNEFANKYAKEMLTGKEPELNEREEVMISLWEMVLIPNDTKH
jgi:hypothetical protein